MKTLALTSLALLAGLLAIGPVAAHDDTAAWSEKSSPSHGAETFGHVEKRASSDPLFISLKSKGRLMDCLMQNTQDGANAVKAANTWLANKPIISQWTQYSDVTAAHWFSASLPADEEEEEQRAKEFAALVSSLQSLAVQSSGFTKVDLEWYARDAPTIRDRNGNLRSLNAWYIHQVNVQDGALLAVDNASPVGNAEANDIDPSVYGPYIEQPNAWSDIMFLQYAQMATTGGASVGGLQHVFRLHVVNTDTLSIIQIASGGTSSATSWQSKLTFQPTRPGATETDSNANFYALLYTPNVRGIAWWLVQHKAQMGYKYVDSISFWNDPNVGWIMYVHIETWTPPSA